MLLFILLSILVLIAAMNIVSGLIMLVKNKGRDIGILRTIGLDQGSILRVFFLVGASIGAIGTLAGFALGVLFVLNIEHIYALLDLNLRAVERRNLRRKASFSRLRSCALGMSLRPWGLVWAYRS